MRTWLRFGPITLRIARRSVETKTKVGPYREVVDRALARLAGYGRLTLRYERSTRLFAAFRTLAATLTYYKKGHEVGQDLIPQRCLSDVPSSIAQFGGDAPRGRLDTLPRRRIGSVDTGIALRYCTSLHQ